MTIDAHQHFWTIARGDYGWLTPALGRLHRDHGPSDLLPLLDDAGVERTILVQAAATTDETEFLLALAHETPRVAGVVGWVDFEAADAPARIEALARRDRVVGVRPMIQDIADVDWMLSDAVAPAFHALEEVQLAFDALVKPPHLRNLRVLLERHPRLRTVVDHGAKPAIGAGALEPWAAELAAVAAETDARCKMSGLVTECGDDASLETLRPFLDQIFESFGPGRVLWGSDWPVVRLRMGYAAWHALSTDYLAALDERDRVAVLGENAAAFYRV